MTINYAIIENEEYAKRMLEHSISTLRPDYRLVFTSDNIADTVDWLASRADVDLIFMDIELDDGNCFDIFNQVHVDTPVIFTTAYDDYAIKAFKVNSVDYLLKPVKQSELQTALTKMEALHPQVSQRVLLRAHGGMTSAPGTAARLFTALYEAGVNIRMIDQGSSEMNIIVGINIEDFETAMNAIYNAFVKD